MSIYRDRQWGNSNTAWHSRVTVLTIHTTILLPRLPTPPARASVEQYYIWPFILFFLYYSSLVILSQVQWLTLILAVKGEFGLPSQADSMLCWELRRGLLFTGPLRYFGHVYTWIVPNFLWNTRNLYCISHTFVAYRTEPCVFTRKRSNNETSFELSFKQKFHSLFYVLKIYSSRRAATVRNYSNQLSFASLY